jgi:CHAP domain
MKLWRWGVVATAAAMVSGLVLLGAPIVVRPAAATPPSTLGPGGALFVGGSLLSPNGHYQAILQSDGNFVVYGPAGAMWSTGTWGTSGGELALQPDGNLVLYGSSGALWSSDTWQTGAAELAMQNDGNLVLYSIQGPLWSSMGGMHDALGAGRLPQNYPLISPDGQYRAILQSDGNFVVYGPGGAIWSTATWGTSGGELVMQPDGNLVLYGSSGALWSNGTWGTRANLLVLQNDGNLVLYGNTGTWWSSEFGISFVSSLVMRAASQDQYYARVIESPPNSGCNPYTAFFGRGDPSGCAPGTSAEAWCSDFAEWVWFGVGVNTTGITGWSYTFVNWGQAHNTWKPGATNNPQPGDAVVWGTTAGAGYGAHVAIVSGVNGGQIDTINGNSDDASGNVDAVSDSGYFDAATSTIDGYPIVGYISPTNLGTGGLVFGPLMVPVPVPHVTQPQINSQDGGR